MKQSKRLGLYVHVPFCRSKCLYCDFCSLPNCGEETVEAYVQALCRDLSNQSRACGDYTVDTVYFGGGTPTYLSAKQLERILQAVRDGYRLSSDAEITSECNPATAQGETLRQMRSMGFNRLSIGLQSAHEEELRALGRIHTYEDFLQTWRDARRAGFDNLSVDLMSGIPEQTPASWKKTLERVISLAPEHVSAYGLILEAGTPLALREGSLALPDEESAEAMYFTGIEMLSAHGIPPYEISNFAKKGYASRHNLKYWNCDEYLGFGPSAYSDFSEERFGNSRDVLGYIEGKDITAERERPDREERIKEYLMLRLRLWEGVREEELRERFGISLEQVCGEAAQRHLALGLLQKNDGGYAFTRRGFYVSNTVLSELLDFSIDA